MKLVKVGKIVNTHGIKGELRILSDFEFKSDVFVPGNTLYLGINKIKEEIKTYRHHKNYEMVTLGDYTNINEVLNYVGNNVYFDRDLLEVDYLLDDLVGMDVSILGELFGKVREIVYNGGRILLGITYDKDYFIPYVNEFIVNVDVTNKIIEVSEMTRGLII